MKTWTRKFIISLMKKYILFVMAFVGIATLSGRFLFHDDQTTEEITRNLINGLIISLIFIFLDWRSIQEKAQIDGKSETKLSEE